MYTRANTPGPCAPGSAALGSDTRDRWGWGRLCDTEIRSSDRSRRSPGARPHCAQIATARSSRNSNRPAGGPTAHDLYRGSRDLHVIYAGEPPTHNLELCSGRTARRLDALHDRCRLGLRAKPPEKRETNRETSQKSRFHILLKQRQICRCSPRRQTFPRYDAYDPLRFIRFFPRERELPHFKLSRPTLGLSLGWV